ncbi:adhesin biosynthesis transcription regulatory family protein [Escherichia coli]|uniref:adhesin biosynthesis transcription regulatory family protein n=1 Tax=Escherichia coli TaxID=562 RepID=UPI0020777717|nr:adhesin biosynthesis transcription regulatory family protein [Escherichia coli]
MHKEMKILPWDYYDKPGSMSHELFKNLIDLSAINSKKVIYALEGYFVHGLSRKDVCKRYDVSQGYLSISLRKIERVNHVVSNLIPFYIKTSTNNGDKLT